MSPLMKTPCALEFKRKEERRRATGPQPSVKGVKQLDIVLNNNFNKNTLSHWHGYCLTPLSIFRNLQKPER